MGHGKKTIKKKGKVWRILDGSYKQPIDKEDVEWLIAAIQQECVWDERDQETFQAIQDGKIDWSGERVRINRKPRKHIRKRS
jgi:hypothetical protein